MSLKDQITGDMNAAMRARDALPLSAIRMLLAAIKQKEVDERIVPDDPAIVAIVDKLIKQRRESIAQFETAGRTDLVDKERAELAVLARYMPQPMSAADIAVQIQSAIAEAGAGSASGSATSGVAGPQMIGKVMALLKPRLAGRADMAAVSAQVKAALAGGTAAR
jgi:uncharacterized protein